MGATMSTLCRQTRHTACVAAGGDTSSCGCTCHYDEEMSGALDAAAELAQNAADANPLVGGNRVGAAAEHDPLPEREPLDPPRIPCPFPGCKREFINTHAQRVHFARAHRIMPPDQDEEEEDVLDESSNVLDDPEVEEVWSPLVADALAAVAFLEGRDENEVIHEVMDEWAGRMRGEPDVGDAMRLRTAYRAGQLAR